MNQKGFAPLLFLAIIVLASIGIIGTTYLAKQILVKQTQVQPSSTLSPEPTISPSPIVSPATEKSTKVIQLVNLAVTVKCDPDQEKTLLDAESNYKNSVDALEKCTRTLPVRGKLCADLCGFRKVGAQAECISPLEKLTPETLTKEVTTQELQCSQKAIEDYDQCLAKCEGFTGSCPASLSNNSAYNKLMPIITKYCQS